jgi:hypothetical protein
MAMAGGSAGEVLSKQRLGSLAKTKLQSDGEKRCTRWNGGKGGGPL